MYNRYSDASALQAELKQVENEIQRVSKKTRDLSEDLGNRYVVFRSSGRPYSRDNIISISRETDEYIQKAYRLEYRRRELLRMLSEAGR